MQRLTAIGLMLLLPVLLSAVPGVAGGRGRANGQARSTVAIVWNSRAGRADSLDQIGFMNAFAAMGFQVRTISVGDLGRHQADPAGVLVIPRSSALQMSGGEVEGVVRLVRHGLALVTDGESALTNVMGVKTGEPRAVRVVLDAHMPGHTLHWADHPSVPAILTYPKAHGRTIYADSADGSALGVVFRVGKGRCLVFSSLFEDVSGQGYARFPTLPMVIMSDLRRRPPFSRAAMDAYFDPGYRVAIPIEKLAALWHDWGIRAVHAAAWYDQNTPSYDYHRLIDAAHKNGIVVYAWLEWPHLGSGFWNKHPEWRQKNALLQDAKLDFLHLMDLQNPDCLTAAFANLSALLKEEWDGVDVAEFTITGAGGEALEGPERPDYFVPFTPTAIAEFKAKAGFSQLELEDSSSIHFWKKNEKALDEFYRYRTDVNNALLRRVLGYVAGLKKQWGRDWELIHTIVDNSLHPEFDYLLGFDQKTTLKLIKEFDVTLNVEDPYMEWTQPPDRYRKLRSTLVDLIPDRSSMIDINVVPVHPMTQEGFASEQATGVELLQQVRMAAERNGRVCVYCESSVNTADWSLIPSAMAMGVAAANVAAGWEISTPHTVLWNMRSGSGLLLDGKAWPCVDSEKVIIPAGTHVVSWKRDSLGASPMADRLRMVSISDELLDAEEALHEIRIVYRSPARCLISVNKLPKGIMVDGLSARLPVVAGERWFVILAPPGRHKITLMED